MLNHQQISRGYSFVEPGSDVSSGVHRHTKVRMLCPLTDGEGAGRPLSSQCVDWVVMGQCLGVSTIFYLDLGIFRLFSEDSCGPFLTSHGPIFFPQIPQAEVRELPSTVDADHELEPSTQKDYDRCTILSRTCDK